MPSLVAQCAGEKEATLKYLPDAGITENEFRNSGLFAMPTHYASKDLIHGKIGATQLRFSQVQARDHMQHQQQCKRQAKPEALDVRGE